MRTHHYQLQSISSSKKSFHTREYRTIQGTCSSAVAQVIKIENKTVKCSVVILTEFIHLIASEASEISDREQRKTILPEHIIEALTVCLYKSSSCFESHIKFMDTYSHLFME